MTNFSISYSVFKRYVLQTGKNQGLFGEGLNIVINLNSVWWMLICYGEGGLGLVDGVAGDTIVVFVVCKCFQFEPVLRFSKFSLGEELSAFSPFSTMFSKCFFLTIVKS